MVFLREGGGGELHGSPSVLIMTVDIVVTVDMAVFIVYSLMYLSPASS